MVVCIGHDNRVNWLHEDSNVKQQPQYLNDENVIVINKRLSFKEIPNDGFQYKYMWDSEKQEIYLEKIVPYENNTVANYQLQDISIINQKLNRIMEHLGIS